jgi:hypothetical protein
MSAPRQPSPEIRAAHSSGMSVIVGVLVACCLSATLLSSLI